MNNKTTWMTMYDLKCLAAFLMVVDHLGVVFELTPFRWLGRFALPLFGYLLISGINHTSNSKAYYFRLLTFASLSQIPYSIFVILNGYSNNLNILFLFVCAYPVIHFFKHRSWLEFTVCGLIAYFFSQHCDAGLYGLGLLLSIYLFSELDQFVFEELIAWLLWLIVILYAYVTIAYYQAIVYPLPIFFSSFKKLSLGQKARWFYWFYPLHFIPLIALKYVTSL